MFITSRPGYLQTGTLVNSEECGISSGSALFAKIKLYFTHKQSERAHVRQHKTHTLVSLLTYTKYVAYGIREG